MEKNGSRDFGDIWKEEMDYGMNDIIILRIIYLWNVVIDNMQS